VGFIAAQPTLALFLAPILGYLLGPIALVVAQPRQVHRWFNLKELSTTKVCIQ
jgi:hypothetical protein